MERRDTPLPGIGALGGVAGGLLGVVLGTSALLMAVREVVLFVRRRAAVGP